MRMSLRVEVRRPPCQTTVRQYRPYVSVLSGQPERKGAPQMSAPRVSFLSDSTSLWHARVATPVRTDWGVAFIVSRLCFASSGPGRGLHQPFERIPPRRDRG